MNKLQETRHFYRFQIRKEEVCRRRADLRNLMICLANSHSKKCLICTSQWILEQPNQQLISLLEQVFNKHFVCMLHIELLFSKILQILLKNPSFISHFLYRDNETSSNTYTRKVILLFEIIDNELFMGSAELQNEITSLFSQAGGFIYQLLDTAYGLNEGMFVEEEQLDGLSNVKRISFNTVLFVFEKYPILFVDLFTEYPLIQMFRQANEPKLLQLYSLLNKIYRQSFQSPSQYSKILIFLEEGVRLQISNVKHIFQPKQLSEELLNLVNFLLSTNSVKNIDTVKQITSLCLSKFQSFQAQVCQIFKVLSHLIENCLRQDEKEYLRPDMTRLHHYVAMKQSQDKAMDLQIL